MNIKHISCLIGLAACISSFGADLPSLKQDKSIRRGKLPDGIEYFVCENTYSRGFADFSLVRKSYPDRKIERDGLRSLEHFTLRAPYRFLADNGVGYGPGSFISMEDGSVSYNFRDVPVLERSVCDSTLLMLFDLAATSEEPQAIIVSGNINSGEVVEKLKMLSLLVPLRSGKAPEEYYTWESRPERGVYYHVADYGKLAGVSLSYRSPRPTFAMMPTAQPLVFRAYSKALGRIAVEHLAKVFTRESIPVANLSFRHRNSSQEPGDEVFRISLWTDASLLPRALSLMASELSAIERNGVEFGEYVRLRKKMNLEEWSEAVSPFRTNSEIVGKCTSCFLYNDNLSDRVTEYNAVAGTSIPPEKEHRFFNSFASALLDNNTNLSLQFDVPEGCPDAAELEKIFDSGWASPSVGEIESGQEKSLPHIQGKVLLVGTAKEPLSGGKYWTFSNGMRVIFLKSGKRGTFDFSLMLRGGSAEVEESAPGEAAFTADMLKISSVAGLSPVEFSELIQYKGVTLNEEVNVSNMRISGSAPSGGLPFVMDMLGAIADRREPGTGYFQYYKKCKAIHLDLISRSEDRVNEVMDSLMRPDYRLSGAAHIATLADDFPQRAEKYFESRFSNVSDGVFILVGDLDEEETKKILGSCLGAFRTSRKRSMRPDAPYTQASGSITVSVDAADGIFGRVEPYANLALSAVIPCTMSNYLNFRVAAYKIEKMLVREMADRGAMVEVSTSVEYFPKERMTVFINCRPCRRNSLPSGVTVLSSYDILSSLRSVVASLETVRISPEELSLWKTAVAGDMARELSDGKTLTDRLILRYCEGKDMVTDYGKKLRDVSEESVKSIIRALLDGGRVEYVTK